jgi:hypothetical protein
MRYIAIDKFEGVNENGLTYNEAIKKHVQDHIDTFQYCSSHINDETGEIDWMNLASIGNARFVISTYYYRELDLLVPKDLAKELKKKIEDSIGISELLEK